MKFIQKMKQWPHKAKVNIDWFLSTKVGFNDKQINLTWHYMRGLWDQVLAIIPISLLQIAALGIFFQMTIEQAGLQVMGLFLAIIGLTCFLDGLRVAVMPMAELVGQELPQRLHLVFVLLVAGCLGILVTYAEPAIAALRPLAELVDPLEAPYLYFLMNEQQELMVFAIGAGVGVAAIIGTLRFIRNWSLKPLIYITLAPTVGLACYMQWGNPNLAPLIGVSWDCGAVTTGPVTVPVLLALGIGVMQSSKKKRLAQAALEGSVASGAGQALEGFGIVTLASLMPILAVELMSIIDGALYDKEYVTNKATQSAADKEDSGTSAIDEPPLQGVIYGIRSIMPLVAALILIIVLILRRPLPECSIWVDPPTSDDSSVKSSESSPPMDNLSRASVAIAKGLQRTESESTMEDGSRDSSMHGGNAAMTAMQSDDANGSIKPSMSIENGKGDIDIEDPSKKSDIKEEKKKFFLIRWTAACGRWCVRNAPLLCGIALAQIGMIAFNEGLAYAFTVLGSQTGQTLPAAFLQVTYNSSETGEPIKAFQQQINENSPYYSYAGGLILVLVIVFLLGVLATRAEPALNVLGRTVERLSNGAFTSKMLIGAVCIGVGVGMAVGSVKILYTVPVIYFILGKYAVAVGLTIITEDAITAVAWDSAGVTTGPVTVPFVLSIGIGFSQAIGSSEGFGILTVMSVAPIISVLTTSLLRKPAKAAGRQLSHGAKSLNKTFKSLKTFRMKRRLDITPSFAMAEFAADGQPGHTPSASREPSVHDPNSNNTTPNV